FRYAGADRKDVWIENDVLWRKAQLFRQNSIRALTYRHFSFDGISLPFFVESHHHNGCTIPTDKVCLLPEYRFAFFQRNTVDNSLPLHTLQSGFNHFPFG